MRFLIAFVIGSAVAVTLIAGIRSIVRRMEAERAREDEQARSQQEKFIDMLQRVRELIVKQKERP
jgi:hypothetical protein